MSWYYYSGKTVRPVPVKKGLSKSVRPHSKIEILEMTMEAQALIRKKELRVTGKPKGAKSVADEPVPLKNIKDVVKIPERAISVAEKGATTSASMPPKTSSGKPQMTEGEIKAREIASQKKKDEAEKNAKAAESGEGVDPSSASDDRDEEKLPDGGEEVDQAEVLSDDKSVGKRTKKRRK